MRVFEPSDSWAYASTENNASVSCQKFVCHFTAMYQSDLYVQASNRAADDAMRFGLEGYETTAQISAALADAYAEIAALYLHAERVAGRA